MPSSNQKKSYTKENRAKGKEYEKLAGEYFAQNGYKILEKNWQAGRKEIDLIVTKENLIIFVEVKSASSKKFGHPSERVDQKKIKNLSDAANQYILVHNLTNIDMRFDVITFIEGTLEHYENAFDVAE
ncbi:MAG TPA: YraN family protein [candidate division Zixibacteria bacterium]|nr:YraN family protein [candidate division Zixibacteria bacterium]